MRHGDASSSSPYPFATGGDRGSSYSYAPGGFSPEGVSRVLPPALGASMLPRLFIQRVDIGALVVRATVQGYIPGKQVRVPVTVHSSETSVDVGLDCCLLTGKHERIVSTAKGGSE